MNNPAQPTPPIDGFPPAGLSSDELYSAFREAEVIFVALSGGGSFSPPPAGIDTLSLIDGEGSVAWPTPDWVAAAKRHYILTGELQTMRSTDPAVHQRHLDLIKRAGRGETFVMSRSPQITAESATSFGLRRKSMPTASALD